MRVRSANGLSTGQCRGEASVVASTVAFYVAQPPSAVFDQRSKAYPVNLPPAAEHSRGRPCHMVSWSSIATNTSDTRMSAYMSQRKPHFGRARLLPSRRQFENRGSADLRPLLGEHSKALRSNSRGADSIVINKEPPKMLHRLSAFVLLSLLSTGPGLLAAPNSAPDWSEIKKIPPAGVAVPDADRDELQSGAAIWACGSMRCGNRSKRSRRCSHCCRTCRSITTPCRYALDLQRILRQGRHRQGEGAAQRGI